MYLFAKYDDMPAFPHALYKNQCPTNHMIRYQIIKTLRGLPEYTGLYRGIPGFRILILCNIESLHLCSTVHLYVRVFLSDVFTGLIVDSCGNSKWSQASDTLKWSLVSNTLSYGLINDILK